MGCFSKSVPARRCEDCGQACMPWFYKCESCFAESRLYRRAGFSSFGDYGYDDDEDFG